MNICCIKYMTYMMKKSGLLQNTIKILAFSYMFDIITMHYYALLMTLSI